MRRNIRRVVEFTAVLCGTLAVVLVIGVYLLQSNWFKNKIRKQVIAQVELASGGRVELDSFDYDWKTVTADFGNFVVHGKEAAGAAPLFQAEHVRIGLKIISVLRRNIDVAAIEVQHPHINLIVAEDGTTNLPIPRSGPVTFAAGVQALLTLKVRHFDLNDGIMEFNFRRMPLNVRGGETFLQLSYERKTRRYDARLSSRQLQITSNGLRPFSGALDASGWFERDRLLLRSATFRLAKSTVRATGMLVHFTHPVADIRLSAEMDASDLTLITKFNDIARGTLTLDGAGHYDETQSIRFDGKLAARDLEYRIEAFDFKKVSFVSDVAARAQDLELNNFALNALGSSFTGNAALRGGREIQLDGSLHALQTEVATSFFAGRHVPWSGVIAGAVHVRGMLDRPDSLALRTDLNVTPGNAQIPISGHLAAAYEMKGKALTFEESSLALPKTRLSFSGTLAQQFAIAVDSIDLGDLKAVFRFLNYEPKAETLPVLLRNGSAHFDGSVSGGLEKPEIAGNLSLTRFQLADQTWDILRSRLSLNERGVDVASLVLNGPDLQLSANGHLGLDGWTPSNNSPLQVKGKFGGVNLVRLARSLRSMNLQGLENLGSGAVASGLLDLHGTLSNPLGNLQLEMSNLDAYGERLKQVNVEATFVTNGLRVTNGRMEAGPATLVFSGLYQHVADSWREGRVQLKIDSNGFPLASLAPAQAHLPGIGATIEVHGQGAARMGPNTFEPLTADGIVALRNVTLNRVSFGDISFKAGTQGQSLTTTFSGDLQESQLTGSAEMQLTKGNPIKGQAHLGRIRLSTITRLLHPDGAKLPFEGLLAGGVSFDGLLQEPAKLHANLQIEKLEINSQVPAAVSDQSNGSERKTVELALNNQNPVTINYSDGVATIPRFQMVGRRSNVTMSGTIPILQHRPMKMEVDGSVDLQLLELLEPDARISGQSVLAATISGVLSDPEVNGTIELRNGSLFANDLPNGLTAVNGAVRFARDRATIERLTAQTGGGQVSMGGFLSFGNGGPLVYRLEATAQNVRVRYAGGVSVTATSQVRLTGTSENSILSGTATISRVIINANTDLGNLLSTSAGPSASPSNEKGFRTGLQFDVHVESAPNLQLSTELSSDVEAEIDLRLRGTPERPILFGSISANQGEVKVFGTKYTINRGEINFANAVKIEPAFDLDLQTQARGVTVDIVISGTPGKFNINYRSDPPLQPRDIVALLTVGRAPDTASTVPNVSVTNDTNALQSGANTVLGQAFAPASDRLSKLFGITNIKIDPMVQGITNTPQARLTVEQQVSKQITVTYVTNLSQTSEQIFRLEWDFSQHFSLVALRDDNGEFGIDIQYRKRFK